jgi:hypothetical protein
VTHHRLLLSRDSVFHRPEGSYKYVQGGYYVSIKWAATRRLRHNSPLSDAAVPWPTYSSIKTMNLLRCVGYHKTSSFTPNHNSNRENERKLMIDNVSRKGMTLRKVSRTRLSAMWSTGILRVNIPGPYFAFYKTRVEHG